MSDRPLPVHPEDLRKQVEACQGAEELRAWMQRESVLSLTDRARLSSIPAAAAQYGLHLDLGLVLMLVEKGYARPLAENPHVQGDALQVLRGLAFAALSAPDEMNQLSRSMAVEVIERLFQSGALTSDSPEMGRLWEQWENRILPAHQLRHLACALLADPALTPQQLGRLALTDPALLPRAVAHPSADLPLWRLALSERSDTHWFAVTQNPNARLHPEIRSRLVEKVERGETGHLGLISHLIGDYLPGDFPRLLKRLVTLDPSRVAEVLDGAPEALRRRLTHEDLLPLLQSPHGEHRLAAIAALPSLGSPAVPEKMSVSHPAARALR